MKNSRIKNRFLILLFSCFLILFDSACKAAENSTYAEPTALTEQEETEAPYEDEPEEDFHFEVDLFFDSETFHYHYVYDNDYLYILLDYDTVSLEEMLQAVDQNDQIPGELKPVVKQYCMDFVTRQPEADCRVLYENLKTLKIKAVDENELAVEALSSHVAATYSRTKNTIFVLEGGEYIKGTWDYQVMYHELSHAARTGVWDIGMTKRRAQCEGPGFNTVTCAEALNTLFTVSLLDYEEEDLAYQLQCNYVQVMLDSMDDYQLSDYMNRSLSYFVSRLGEINDGDIKPVVEVMKLIEEQYKDFYSTSKNNPPEMYYPIYDFISRIYYKKRITAETSYEEARKIANELIMRIMKNVQDEYHIPTDHFYRYFEQYYYFEPRTS